MSRDGSGNYTRVPGSAYTNGTTADGSEIDAEINDIATALTQSIAKDGQTVPTANLPMGGYKHTNVNTASARTEYARASQVQDGTLAYLTSVSGADTITASAPIGLSAYAAGQEFGFIAAGANTGAVTLNINGIGAKDVTKRGSTALVADDIISGSFVIVRYDGTRFQVVTQILESDVVRITGAQTIAGVKTFSDKPVIPDATAAQNPVSKAQLDAVSATIAPAVLVPTISDDMGADVSVTSGTSHQILGVPAWALRVEIEFLSISGDGADQWGIQVGNTATGFATTGYAGSVSGGTSTLAFSNGFTAMQSTAAAAVWNGRVVLSRARAADTTWIYTGWLGRSDSAAIVHLGAGRVTITDLDRVRIAMLGGSSAFDGSGSMRVKAGV